MTTLQKGDKAPQFEAKDQDGNTIKLADYSGKKLVLFFYLVYYNYKIISIIFN